MTQTMSYEIMRESYEIINVCCGFIYSLLIVTVDTPVPQPGCLFLFTTVKQEAKGIQMRS